MDNISGIFYYLNKCYTLSNASQMTFFFQEDSAQVHCVCVIGFGHTRWGIGSAVWTRRNTTLLHVYFVSFTSFHCSYNHHVALLTRTSDADRFPALLADSPGLDSLPRGASPAAGVGSAARANQRITSWPFAAVGWYNG